MISKETILHAVRPYMTSTMVLFIVFMAAWFMNGYTNTHFDLNMLITFYGVLIGQKLGTHAVNSVFNSPKGESPPGPK